MDTIDGILFQERETEVEVEMGNAGGPSTKFSAWIPLVSG